MPKKSDDEETETKNYFCGMGEIPKGKIRAHAEYCLRNRQVRYYGVVAIDPGLLKKYLSGLTGVNIQKEQIKLKKLENEAKLMIKTAKRLKRIINDKETNASDMKKAKKMLESLMKKRDKLKEKLRKQDTYVKQLLAEEKKKKKATKK
jgi:ATPase subunit of ABC transporter with duplicated ATPase domains